MSVVKWLSRYRHLRLHDIWAIIFGLIGTTANAGLALAQFQTLTIGHWAMATLMVLAPAFGVAEALTRGNINRSAEERDKRQRIVRKLVEDTCGTVVRLMSACPSQTGCIVFLPDSDGLLYPRFAYNKENQPDRNVSFRPLVGCTGHAWGQGRQTRANLSEATSVDLATTWKLSPEQITLTAHLRTVVSTPIWNEDAPDVMLGVVTVDSQADETTCGITTDESADEARQLAVLLARILKLAD
ncbi:MAG: hypothetical protein ACKVVP_04685 [Chloroflexota bacterium]